MGNASSDLENILKYVARPLLICITVIVAILILGNMTKATISKFAPDRIYTNYSTVTNVKIITIIDTNKWPYGTNDSFNPAWPY